MDEPDSKELRPVEPPPSVPKPPEVLTPLPGPDEQRLVAVINNGDGPDTVLQQLAGQNEISPKKLIIDIGPGGGIKSINQMGPEDVPILSTTEVNPDPTEGSDLDRIPNRPPKSPKTRWEGRENEGQNELEQKLTEIQAEGTKLAEIIYTQEGRSRVETVRDQLSRIVSETFPKPAYEPLPADMPMDSAQAQEINKQRKSMEMEWQKKVEARVDKLLRGGEMASAENTKYLSEMLGLQPLPSTDPAENQRRKDLLQEFNRERSTIGRALAYQDSESKPVDQRDLPISERDLKFSGISTLDAQEAFASGWNRVKDINSAATTETTKGIDTPRDDVSGGLSETPDIDTSEEIVGGLTEAIPTENIDGTEVVGGVASETPGRSEKDSTELDPKQLLRMERMNVDDFFGLSLENVYTALRDLQILPPDDPNYIRYMKIRELLDRGRDDFLRNNPGATEVTF